MLEMWKATNTWKCWSTIIPFKSAKTCLYRLWWYRWLSKGFEKWKLLQSSQHWVQKRIKMIYKGLFLGDLFYWKSSKRDTYNINVNSDIIYGLIPGGTLMLIFIIGMIVSFWPRKKKPKVWLERNEDGDFCF